MSIRHYLPLACVMMGSSFAAELKRADFIGSWQVSWISGKEGQDLSKHVMHFKEDGTIHEEGRPACSWHYARTEGGLQLLMIDTGGGDKFMTVVVDIKDGEMTWSPFHREEPRAPLKPGGKVAFRFKKIVPKEK